MAIDFFEKEVRKVQKRFNQTFGETQAINLSTRFNVILSIINLMMIAKEINQQNKTKDIAKIKEFMKVKSIINNVFDKFGNEQKHNKIRKEKVTDGRFNYDQYGQYGSRNAG